MKRKPSNSELMPPKEPPKNPVVEKARRVLEKKQEAFRRERSRHKRNDPAKMKARAMVNNAIQKGDLIPQNCEYQFKDCRTWPTEAHHYRGYSEGDELNIRWVCKSCHDKITIREKATPSFRSTKNAHSYPDQVIHLVAPPLSGKSYILREAQIDEERIYDLIKFYVKVGAVVPGELFPPKLRLLNPKEYYAKAGGMIHDFNAFITSGISETLFVESSGNSKKLNQYLIDHKRDFHTETMCIQAPDLNTLVHRCKLRKLDIIKVKGMIETWRWKSLDSKIKDVREYTQEEAIEVIRDL